MSIKSKNKVIKAALGDTLGGMTNYSKKFADNIVAKELEEKQAKVNGYGFNLGEQAGNLTQEEIYDIWANYENSEDFNRLSNKVKDSRRKAFTGYLSNFKNSTISGTPGLNAMESFSTDNQYYADLQEQAKTDKYKKAEYENLLGVIRVLGGHNAAGAKFKSKANALNAEKVKTDTAVTEVPKGLTPEQIAQFKSQNIASQVYKFKPETIENDLSMFYSNRFGKTIDGKAFSNPTSLNGYQKQIGDYLQTRAQQALGEYSSGYNSSELAEITQAKMAYDEALASGDPNKINIALINYGRAMGENERDIRLGIATTEDELRSLLFKQTGVANPAQSTATTSTQGTNANTGKTETVNPITGIPLSGSSLSEWSNYTGPKFTLGDATYSVSEIKNMIANNQVQDPQVLSALNQFISTYDGKEYEPFYEALAGNKNPIDDVNNMLYEGLYTRPEFNGASSKQAFDISEHFETPDNISIAMVRDVNDDYKFVVFKDGYIQDGTYTADQIKRKFKLLQNSKNNYKPKELRADKRNIASLEEDPGASMGVNTGGAAAGAIRRFNGGAIGEINKYNVGGAFGESSPQLHTAPTGSFRDKEVSKRTRTTNLGDIGATISGEGNYHLTGEDYTELAALGLDITSAIAAGKSLWGSTAAGVAGTALNAGARISRGGDFLTEVLPQAGIGLALDVAGAIPVLGQAAGAAKVVRALKHAKWPVIAALTASSLKGGYEVATKIKEGRFDEIDTQDLMLIAGSITALGKAKTAKKADSLIEDSATTTFKDKAGKEITLTKDQIENYNKSTGKKREEILTAANTNNANLKEAGFDTAFYTRIPYLGSKIGQVNNGKVFKDFHAGAESVEKGDKMTQEAQNYIQDLYNRVTLNGRFKKNWVMTPDQLKRPSPPVDLAQPKVATPADQAVVNTPFAMGTPPAKPVVASTPISAGVPQQPVAVTNPQGAVTPMNPGLNPAPATPVSQPVPPAVPRGIAPIIAVKNPTLQNAVPAKADMSKVVQYLNERAKVLPDPIKSLIARRMNPVAAPKEVIEEATKPPVKTRKISTKNKTTNSSKPKETKKPTNTGAQQKPKNSPKTKSTGKGKGGKKAVVAKQGGYLGTSLTAKYFSGGGTFNFTLNNPFSTNYDPYKFNVDTSTFSDFSQEREALKNSGNLNLNLKGQTPGFNTNKGIANLKSYGGWNSGITSPDKYPINFKDIAKGVLSSGTDGILRAGQYLHSQRKTDALKEYTKVNTPYLETTRTPLRPVSEDLQYKQGIADRIAQLRSMRSNSGDPNISMATRLSAESQANQLYDNYSLNRSRQIGAIQDKNLEIERMNDMRQDQTNNQNSIYQSDAMNRQRNAEGILQNRKFQNTETAFNMAAMKAESLKNLYKQKLANKLGYDNTEYQNQINILSNPASTLEQKTAAQNKLDQMKKDYESKLLDIKGI